MPEPIQAEPREDFLALTHQVPVTVHLDGNDTLEVFLFLANLSPTHEGPESLDEHLSRQRDYVPVRFQGEEKEILLRREGIQRVEVGSDAPTLFTMVQGLRACEDFVRVQLRDGSKLDGTLKNILPSAAPRLSDVMNDPHTDFIVLEGKVGVDYINKRFINIVWLTDES